MRTDKQAKATKADEADEFVNDVLVAGYIFCIVVVVLDLLLWRAG